MKKGRREIAGAWTLAAAHVSKAARRGAPGIIGTWHRVSAKHLQAYLNEMTWRFDNRKNPYLFRDTMLKLIHSESLEYKELTKAAQQDNPLMLSQGQYLTSQFS